MKRVTVIGLGLIGGSVGLALRERDPEVVVTGIDRPEIVASPVALRVAHDLVATDDPTRVAGALAAELVVLAAPVGVIQRELSRVLDQAEVAIDCGSTKRAICASVAGHRRRSRFVPGHPMAGMPEGGIEQARADLFEGRRWLICPEESSAEACAVAEKLIALVGAQAVRLTAAEHDRAVARTSHVPQLLASALLVAANSMGAAAAAGPAFAGATRVAGGPEAMWRDIFATNADEIANALRELVAELGTIQQDLNGRPASLTAALGLLERARRLRKS
ncbi:MAG TPA: prephenate dehydrogenase/arogenate dehydrogenase family protein [Polyangiaceae bacterium]|nr:prephenate dehydrogenase/arogenate dehydrogenase family protein [Polyangiaceae bacterium]